jgi:hypothetical protein
MNTYTFKMTRVYETIIKVEAENENDAFNRLRDIEVYQMELEQCCVVDETMELEEDYTLEDKVTGMFINQMSK